MGPVAFDSALKSRIWLFRHQTVPYPTLPTTRRPHSVQSRRALEKGLADRAETWRVGWIDPSELIADIGVIVWGNLHVLSALGFMKSAEILLYKYWKFCKKSAERPRELKVWCVGFLSRRIEWKQFQVCTIPGNACVRKYQSADLRRNEKRIEKTLDPTVHSFEESQFNQSVNSGSSTKNFGIRSSNSTFK